MIFRACSFSTFHYTSRAFINTNTNTTNNADIIMPYFIAGGITGFCIAFIETPIDLIKTKLQTQIFLQRLDAKCKPQYSNVRGCIKYISNKHGIRALWQGLMSTIIRNVPANSLFFPGIYHNHHNHHRNNHHCSK